MDNSVFISYRRDASAFMARAIFQDLRAHGYDVFMDVENVDSGHFDEIILNQIAARPYFLLILTPGTLERCGEPEDWVRREIECALRLKRVIIPLTTPNFNFADAKPLLQGSLAELSRFNGVDVPHNYFDEAMGRLRKRFLKPIDLPTSPTPETDRDVVERKLERALAEEPVTAQQLSAQDYYERTFKHPYEDLSGRIDELTEALRIDPNFVGALFARANLYSKARWYDEAFADLTHLLDIDATNADAYYDRGMIQAKTEDAISDFTHAIRLDQGNNNKQATAYIRRGFAYKSKDDVNRALADLKQALELQPDHPLAPIIENYINNYSQEQSGDISTSSTAS
ncbi:MAG TPA: TIR domain-containing protein [Aggregatilineales bacterium]|nr:TIR domain-containing protein [Aggregatilineales bacterium]